MTERWRREPKVKRDIWGVFSRGFKAIPAGCWCWVRGLVRGYGQYWDPRTQKKGRAHRLSWELHFGPVPDGLCVLHRCDNRGCVNPGHLFLGTVADNNTDMARKGRSTRKLTDAQVCGIRAKLSAGVPERKIASECGLSHGNLYRIKTRETYAWVIL